MRLGFIKRSHQYTATYLLKDIFPLFPGFQHHLGKQDILDKLHIADKLDIADILEFPWIGDIVGTVFLLIRQDWSFS